MGARAAQGLPHPRRRALLLKSAAGLRGGGIGGSIVAVVPADDVHGRGNCSRRYASSRRGGRRERPPGLGARGAEAGPRGVRRHRARARRRPSLRGRARCRSGHRGGRRAGPRSRCCPSWTPSSVSARNAWSRPSTGGSSAPPRPRKGFRFDVLAPSLRAGLSRRRDRDRRGDGASSGWARGGRRAGLAAQPQDHHPRRPGLGRGASRRGAVRA